MTLEEKKKNRKEARVSGRVRSVEERRGAPRSAEERRDPRAPSHEQIPQYPTARRRTVTTHSSSPSGEYVRLATPPSIVPSSSSRGGRCPSIGDNDMICPLERPTESASAFTSIARQHLAAASKPKGTLPEHSSPRTDVTDVTDVTSTRHATLPSESTHETKTADPDPDPLSAGRGSTWATNTRSLRSCVTTAWSETDGSAPSVTVALCSVVSLRFRILCVRAKRVQSCKGFRILRASMPPKISREVHGDCCTRRPARGSNQNGEDIKSIRSTMYVCVEGARRRR